MQLTFDRGSLSRLALFWLVIACTCQAALAASADNQGWVLTQKSQRMGDQYVYISQQGLKLVNPKLGFAMVSQAPNWDICFFNNQTHKYYETTADRWQRAVIARNGVSQFMGRSWLRAGQGSIAGLGSVAYRMNGAWVKRDADGRLAPSGVTGATYYVASGIRLPPKLINLLAIAYGLPVSNSLPLRLTYTESGSEQTILDTYRVARAALPIAYFARPAGFTRAPSDVDVMMSQEQSKMVQQMAQDLGSSPDSRPGVRQAVQKYAATGNASEALKQLPPDLTADDLKAALETYKRQMGK